MLAHTVIEVCNIDAVLALSNPSSPSTHHDILTNLTGDDSILDTLEVGIEAPLQTRHELDTSLIAGIDSLDGLGEVGGKGLLAEHVFSVGGAGLDLLGVVLGGRADPDGVDLGIGDNLHGICGEARDAKIGGGCCTNQRGVLAKNMRKSRSVKVKFQVFVRGLYLFWHYLVYDRTSKITMSN